MNEEIQTPEAAEVDLKAQAEAAATAAKENDKAAKAALKEGKMNLTAAVKYNEAIAAEDENKATAEETEAGWKAEVSRLEDAALVASEELKAANAALKEAKAAAKEAKAAQPKAPKVERIRQNGQTAPKEGTISYTLWTIFQSTMDRLQRVPAVTEVMIEAREAGVVDGSIKAGYAQWRKFNGFTGRIESQAQMDAKAEQAAKAAERLAAKEAKAAADRQAAAEAAAAAAAAAPEAPSAE